MNPNDLKKIAEYQQQIARLEKSVAKFNRKLLALPAKFGFKSMGEFIAALQQAAGGKSGAVSAKVGGQRTRAKITPEIKQKVKALVAADKTGAAIAEELGISLPSVQNIKKELGLVKKRKG